MDTTITTEPIPCLWEPPNWGRLPIFDNDEPLVPLPQAGRLRGQSLYAEQGIPNAEPVVSVRFGVFARLQAAVAVLPPDVSLIVFDGYRPLAVQQYLWDSYLLAIARAEQHLSPDEVEQKTRRFVAAPVADPLRPPPHRTGGATDVYLVDAATGEPLPMGTAPDEVSEASATRYFEEHLEDPFTTNRRLLFHAMYGAGFANYHGEWWHYEYGNQRWANTTGAAHAVYGLPGDGEIGL